MGSDAEGIGGSLGIATAVHDIGPVGGGGSSSGSSCSAQAGCLVRGTGRSVHEGGAGVGAVIPGLVSDDNCRVLVIDPGAPCNIVGLSMRARFGNILCIQDRVGIFASD